MYTVFPGVVSFDYILPAKLPHVQQKLRIQVNAFVIVLECVSLVVSIGYGDFLIVSGKSVPCI